ncbi:hypothetical protein [Kribbella soli]|uniref:Uncharacterized protein n=1 Tax=Kribbella soli TaxID=1124743 RepID=A0A4R0HF23_9ACTN|nr:hypothetical protein [Kribbella soli]TCC08010.1 hypothetical protein E0H45_18990 [Kribbella soli]
MMDPDWHDDEKLIEALRDALASADEVPSAFVEAGKAAFAWRTIDAELAALTYDSAQDPLDALAIRSESAILRSLTFASDGWTVELELTPDAVLGQLDPPEVGTVTARGDGGKLATAEIDELGFFVLGPPPNIPYRLVCTTQSGTTILTGWVTP